MTLPVYQGPNDGDGSSGGGTTGGTTGDPNALNDLGSTIAPGQGWKPHGPAPRHRPAPSLGGPVGDPGNMDASGDPFVTATLPPVTIVPTHFLLPSPTPATENGRTDTVVPTDQPLPFIYGKARCGGQVVYEKVQTDGAKIVIWLIGWGPINQISNILVDGKEPVATYSATIHTYTGTQAQTVDSLMSAMEPTWTSGLPGIAYVVGGFPKPTATQPAPNVRAFSVDVQGRLVRDPRTDATLFARSYKDNPALCEADYMTSDQFGGGLADPLLDWAGSITTAANDCDAIIDGGSLKRYTIGLWAGDQKDFDQWVSDIRAIGALVVVFNSGLWQIWMEKAQGAASVTITDAGVNANINNAGPITVQGAKQCWTRVKINFTDIANGYKTNTAMDEDPGLGNGTTDLIEQTYDFPGVPTYDQARRLARQYRKRSQKDKLVPIRLLPDGGISVLPGVRVPVTSQQLNWSAVDALCTQISPTPEGYWDAQFEQYDANVYDDTVQTTTGYAPPINPSVYDPPPNIITLTLDITTNPAKVYWDPPVSIATQNYATGLYSQTNCGAYDGTKVSDGLAQSDGGTKAFDWNVAADSTITLDIGVGNTKDFRQIAFDVSDTTVFGTFAVEFSDNGSSWTAVTDLRRGGDIVTVGITASALPFGWSSTGAHRYWRFRKGSSVALAVNFFEVTWREAIATSALIDHFIIYNSVSGVRGAAIQTLKAVAAPTKTNPLTLPPSAAVFTGKADGTSDALAQYEVVAVSISGVPSSGVNYYKQFNNITVSSVTAYVPTKGASLSLINAGNNDVILDALADLFAITGPTLGFSVSGLVANRDGQLVTLWNTTAQVCTILNANTGSAVANRIITGTGANVVLAAQPGFATLKYSNSQSRWALISHT